MTKARLHPALLEFTGAMGDMVFKRRGNKVYVCIKSQGTSNPSEAQLAQRKVFKKAINHAKGALADEATRAFYEALAEGKQDTNAHALCIGDYLNAPIIDELDLAKYRGNVGDRILINTSDDVGVIEVNVELVKSDGTHIENGKAVEIGAGSGEWEYVATVPVPLGTDIFVEAEAFDRPRNRAVSSANPIVGESH